MDGTHENSSDLERAAAARSIANKFSGVPSIDQKLQRCENMGFHFHAAPFGTRSLRGQAKTSKMRHFLLKSNGFF